MANSAKECTKGELKVEAIDANINVSTYVIKIILRALVTCTVVYSCLFGVKTMIPAHKLTNSRRQISFGAISGILSQS